MKGWEVQGLSKRAGKNLKGWEVQGLQEGLGSLRV